MDDLEKFLDNLEAISRGKTINNERLRNSIESAERLRAALQDRIFRALSMLGQMTYSNFSINTGLEQLDSAREAIEVDMQLYSEARREVEELMEAPYER